MSNLLKITRCSLSTTPQALHFSSHKKDHLRHWSPGYFYDGIDLPPRTIPKNIRDINQHFGKYVATTRTRVRFVDNSQLALAGMKWYRKPMIINVIGPNQGLDRGSRDVYGSATAPKKIQAGRVGDLVVVAAAHQVARAVIVGGKNFSGGRGFRSRQDTLNAVLLNNEMEPLGNRIMVPVPGWLRDCDRMPRGIKVQYNKLFSIASRGYY